MQYRYYVLFILSLTYAFSFMDRQIVSILLGDLKAEFDLNDTQLGLLSGLAFALFYSTLAVPIARLADRHNRVMIISIAMTIWSGVTALCAAVGNFTQLFLARVGVGVGEAGGVSPSHSIISDYFNERERSLALSLFSLGAAFGAMMGMAVGGLIAENYGWRMAFVAAGLPGVVLAIIVKLTVREPQRGSMEGPGGHALPDQVSETFMETLRDLIHNRLYLGVYIAHTLVVYAGYALSAWLPQVMLRRYDVSQSEVGSVIGVVYFIGVAGGMLAGGLLATRFSRKDLRMQLRVPVLGLLASLPVFYFAFTAESFMTAAVFFGAALFLFNMQHGPSLAVVQSAVKPHQRATAASLTFLASNLFGLGLGPLAVGFISDALAAEYGDLSLSIALATTIIVAAPAVIVFYRVSKYLGETS